jgi:hypothetical protein
MLIDRSVRSCPHLFKFAICLGNCAIRRSRRAMRYFSSLKNGGVNSRDRCHHTNYHNMGCMLQLLVLLAFALPSLGAVDVQVTTQSPLLQITNLFHSGASHNRVDLVFFSDGCEITSLKYSITKYIDSFLRRYVRRAR